MSTALLVEVRRALMIVVKALDAEIAARKAAGETNPAATGR